MKWSPSGPRLPVLFASLTAAAALGTGSALLGSCGPFNDFTDPAFCSSVLEIFYAGITTGTTPTTYDPSDPVIRLQMAAFLSRTVDAVLKRGGRRTALGQTWPSEEVALSVTTVGISPGGVQFDGEDLWVSNFGTVSRVRASDGRLLETWTGAASADGVVSAMGQVLLTAQTSPGKLYWIDPSRPAGAVATVATNLGDQSNGPAFDGGRIWTANVGSVSIVTPAVSAPWTVTTVSTGFTHPVGALYDGSNVWVTDYGAAALRKLDSSGAILQSVTVGILPTFAVFDGAGIWVPNQGDNSVTVVRASSGAVLATLTGNGLSTPSSAAFDGERILVADSGVARVSLWKAADLTPLGFITTVAGSTPFGACSDGIHFWVTLSTIGQLARF